MRGLILLAVLGVAAPAWGAGGVTVEKDAGEWIVRVPLRGTPGAPEVRSAPGEVTVEVPEGKVERGSTAMVGEGMVREVVTATSHSRKRASVVIRLKDGRGLAVSGVRAGVEGGGLVVRMADSSASATTSGSTVAVAPTAAATATTTPTATPMPAPAATLGAEAGRKNGELALRVAPLLALLGVLGWLLAKYTRKGKDLQPTAIDILATRMLGRNQRLMVVDVARKRFLLSASEQAGVRMIARITPAGMEGEEKGSQEGVKDGLDEVFAEMLDDLDEGAAPRPKAPPAPAARTAGRPALQLVPVDDGPENAIAEGPPPRSVPKAPPAPARDNGGDSADVAGLLALRRQRQGAAR